MIDFVKVGNRIQNLRKNSDLSQESLAEQLFITRQALSKWENGTSIPSIDSLLEISKIFNVSFEYLLCLGEEDGDIDPDDIFKGHERNYIIQKIVQGKLDIDIPNVILLTNMLKAKYSKLADYKIKSVADFIKAYKDVISL